MKYKIDGDNYNRVIKFVGCEERESCNCYWGYSYDPDCEFCSGKGWGMEYKPGLNDCELLAATRREYDILETKRKITECKTRLKNLEEKLKTLQS